VIRRDYFPYFTQGKPITIDGLDVFAVNKANAPAHDSLSYDNTIATPQTFPVSLDSAKR